MGVWSSTTTPAPSQEREEDLAGVGNIDNSNSEINSKKNSVNDYSVDLNFISLHLNTLASSGAILVCLIILLIVARFLLRGGCSRLMNQILALNCLPVPRTLRSTPPGAAATGAPTSILPGARLGATGVRGAARRVGGTPVRPRLE